jgi:two-component system sensor histidine kinase ArlS
MMPVRFKITVIFTLLVMFIWAVVCGGIYYFSASARQQTIRTRLFNRALTTARLLAQSEIFDHELIRRIDSSTTLTLKRKSVQVYRRNGTPVYDYAEITGDTIPVETDIIKKTLETGTFYYVRGSRDVVSYHYSQSWDELVVICAAEDVEGKASLARLKKILLFSFLGGGIFTFLGGYFFSRQLLRPVARIANEVKDISAYSLDRRIHTHPNNDEWFHLSSTLNELLDRLKESFDMQRRFISNASHELSTPLTLISSQLEISLQRHRSEEDYRRAMQTVLLDVRHMNNLVQTLLKFATASGDSGGLNIELVRIDEILMRLPAEMKKKNKENSVSLNFGHLPDDEQGLLVLGNEELIFTAIANIVSNACKYSEDHVARVTLSSEANEFFIHVVDNGPGIEEKELNNIFQPFYRTGDRGAIEGFGLGLSLASRIIKLHKGRILVSSKPGQGSTFTIVIPVAHSENRAKG